jgi:hypothetical protein
MLIPGIDIIGERDRISAREYNRRGKTIQTLTRSAGTLALSDSSGLHIRRSAVVGEFAPVFAYIIQTLRRENIETGDTLRNWYEIDFVSNLIPEHDSTKSYSKDTKVKDNGQVYNAFRDVPTGIAISNTSYWEESSSTKAYVFGYDEDLIEGDNWIPVGVKVEVIYDEGEWRILETVQRIQYGTGENIKCSLYVVEELVDGRMQTRLASVYR